MKEASDAIARWLEEERRRDRVTAAVISALALGSGLAVFLLTAFLIYCGLFLFCGWFARTVFWPGAVALGMTAGIFAWTMKGREDEWSLGLDPLGMWIIKDFCSVGPRLVLEGLRFLRRFDQLEELNVGACAQALAYLASRNSAVTRVDLMQHCPLLAWPRLQAQLLLVDGVLFLGEDASRVTLMEPFRVRLRWMLGGEFRQEKARDTARDQARFRPKVEAAPKPEPAPEPQVVPVTEPEKLSPLELLGLSATATVVEIKTAYRKRVKECHPDRFANMDQRARELAERWTKALNAAYSSLMAQQGQRARR
jgi:DnaJ like chaperone protein